jgi:hypothetical protein
MITSNIQGAINALRKIQKLIETNDREELIPWLSDVYSLTDDGLTDLHAANKGIAAAESALKGVINEL